MSTYTCVHSKSCIIGPPRRNKRLKVDSSDPRGQRDTPISGCCFKNIFQSDFNPPSGKVKPIHTIVMVSLFTNVTIASYEIGNNVGPMLISCVLLNAESFWTCWLFQNLPQICAASASVYRTFIIKQMQYRFAVHFATLSMHSLLI